MSYTIGDRDYSALAAAMLDGVKAHIRVMFATDDDEIKRCIRWSLAYIETELGWIIAKVDVAWQPLIAANIARYRCPVGPVTSFKVMSGSVDVSDEYRLDGTIPSPVWLVKKDGTGFPADAVITLTCGYDDAAKMPPNVEAGVYRVAGTLYEYRESITSFSLDGMPFWLRDLLDGLWVPRA